MQYHFMSRLAAVLISAALCAPVTASAEDGTMQFRLTAAKTYFTEEALRSGDALTDGALRIDNYSGLSYLRLHLVSDDPVSIENLDFARDSSRKEPDGSYKQCYFETHGDTALSIPDENGKSKNICLWYGPGKVEPQNGVVENPDSPFLTFSVRVPQGTKAGVYQANLSKEVTISDVGQKEYDFQAYSGSDRVDVPCVPLQIVVEPEALLGDVDCSGTVEFYDASLALRLFTLTSSGGFELTDDEIAEITGTPYIHTALTAADVDRNQKIEASDASAILVYATMKMIGLNPSWDDLT